MDGNGCINECDVTECGFRGSRKLSLFVVFPGMYLYTFKWFFQLIFPSLCEVTVVHGGKSGKYPIPYEEHCGLFSFYHYNLALLFFAWKGLYWNELIASYDDESGWFYMFHGYSLFLMGWEIIDFPFCIAHCQKCQRCQGDSVGSLWISIFKQIHFCHWESLHRNQQKFCACLILKIKAIRDYCEVTGLCINQDNFLIIVTIIGITKFNH